MYMENKQSKMYKELTKLETKVHEYIIDNKSQVIYQTINELASAVDVGETTVLRYCKKIGYKGYQDFKLALTKEVSLETSKSNSDFKNLGEFADIVKNTVSNNINIIEQSAEYLEEDVLYEVVKMLKNSERTLLVGSSMSGNSAQDAQNRFLRLGIETEFYKDSHLELMVANLLTDKDLVIAFSVNGSTKDTIEAIELAKNNGAKVISITNKKHSKVGQLSDLVLLTAGRETLLEGGSLPAKISQLFIINIIYNILLKENEKEFEKNRKKTSEAITSKLY